MKITCRTLLTHFGSSSTINITTKHYYDSQRFYILRVGLIEGQF